MQTEGRMHTLLVDRRLYHNTSVIKCRLYTGVFRSINVKICTLVPEYHYGKSEYHSNWPKINNTSVSLFMITVRKIK